MVKRPVPPALKKVAKAKKKKAAEVFVILMDGPREVGPPAFERSDLKPGTQHLRLPGWPDFHHYELDHIDDVTGVHYYRFTGVTDGTGLAR